jgi:hypothetical protein
MQLLIHNYYGNNNKDNSNHWIGFTSSFNSIEPSLLRRKFKCWYNTS